MNFLVIGAISGFLIVILGAFGAHGLKDILDEYGKSIYEKAVLYHMFHTMAIVDRVLILSYPTPARGVPLIYDYSAINY